MSTITESPVDVAVMGLGMMAGPVCAELCLAGHTVAGIEKGPYLDYAVDFAESAKFDEWKTTFQHYFDHKLTTWTYSIRNNSNQFALPNRRTDKQTVPEGHEVGGMGVHYGTHLGRVHALDVSGILHDAQQVWGVFPEQYRAQPRLW